MPTMRDAKKTGMIYDDEGIRRAGEPMVLSETEDYRDEKKRKKGTKSKTKFWEPDEDIGYSQGMYIYDEAIKDRTRQI